MIVLGLGAGLAVLALRAEVFVNRMGCWRWLVDYVIASDSMSWANERRHELRGGRIDALPLGRPAKVGLPAGAAVPLRAAAT